jgi:hypothetical protein
MIAMTSHALEGQRDLGGGYAGSGGLGQRRAHPGDRPVLGQFALPLRPQRFGRNHRPERRREPLAELSELPVPGHVDSSKRRASRVSADQW